MASDNSVQVTLSRTQALVLFEWLASLDESEVAPPADSAERTVLWKIEGQLESVLTEVVGADYHEQVCNAKKAVLSDA